MDFEAAKMVGAGLAAIGVGMAALGVGNVFGSFLESALRNPAAADGQSLVIVTLYVTVSSGETTLCSTDFSTTRSNFG